MSSRVVFIQQFNHWITVNLFIQQTTSDHRMHCSPSLITRLGTRFRASEEKTRDDHRRWCNYGSDRWEEDGVTSSPPIQDEGWVIIGLKLPMGPRFRLRSRGFWVVMIWVTGPGVPKLVLCALVNILFLLHFKLRKPVTKKICL